MEALRNRPAGGKAPRGGLRGRMPVKRSINLTLGDEKKIHVGTAIPAILAIVVLAALFSKFLVWDRLMEVSSAAAKAAKAKTDLDNAIELVQGFGDIEDRYAHYTVDGMTAAELGLVDRVAVLELIDTVLPVRSVSLATGYFSERLSSSAGALRSVGNGVPTMAGIGSFLKERLGEFLGIVSQPTEAGTWSVSGNVLTIDVTGESLDTMNAVAAELELSPIVDTCTITTANKSSNQNIAKRVAARFVVYLIQPVAEEVAAQ